MSKQNNLKDVLQHDLALLAQTRDELLVQLSLAQAEARDDWKVLEERWFRVQGEIKRTATESEQTVRDLLDDLKGGYERIKTQLKESTRKN